MATQTGRPIAPARKLMALVLGTIAAFTTFVGLGMGKLVVVLVSLVLLALSIALGMVNMVRRGARAWVEGSAEVKAVSPAPTSAAAYGRAEIVAVIVAPGLATTEVTIRDPRVPVSKWPVPGDTLPISVDVDDTRRVKIKWDVAGSRPEPEIGADPPAPEPTQYDAATDDDDNDLLGDIGPLPWNDPEHRHARDAGPVVVTETAGGTVVEGEFVDHNEAPPTLPKRARATSARANSDSPDSSPLDGDGDSASPSPSPSPDVADSPVGSAAAGPAPRPFPPHEPPPPGPGRAARVAEPHEPPPPGPGRAARVAEAHEPPPPGPARRVAEPHEPPPPGPAPRAADAFPPPPGPARPADDLPDTGPADRPVEDPPAPDRSSGDASSSGSRSGAASVLDNEALSESSSTTWASTTSAPGGSDRPMGGAASGAGGGEFVGARPAGRTPGSPPSPRPRARTGPSTGGPAAAYSPTTTLGQPHTPAQRHPADEFTGRPLSLDDPAPVEQDLDIPLDEPAAYSVPATSARPVVDDTAATAPAAYGDPVPSDVPDDPTDIPLEASAPGDIWEPFDIAAAGSPPPPADDPVVEPQPAAVPPYPAAADAAALAGERPQPAATRRPATPSQVGSFPTAPAPVAPPPTAPESSMTRPAAPEPYDEIDVALDGDPASAFTPAPSTRFVSNAAHDATVPAAVTITDDPAAATGTEAVTAAGPWAAGPTISPASVADEFVDSSLEDADSSVVPGFAPEAAEPATDEPAIDEPVTVESAIDEPVAAQPVVVQPASDPGVEALEPEKHHGRLAEAAAAVGAAVAAGVAAIKHATQSGHDQPDAAPDDQLAVGPADYEPGRSLPDADQTSSTSTSTSTSDSTFASDSAFADEPTSMPVSTPAEVQAPEVHAAAAPVVESASPEDATRDLYATTATASEAQAGSGAASVGLYAATTPAAHSGRRAPGPAGISAAGTGVAGAVAEGARTAGAAAVGAASGLVAGVAGSRVPQRIQAPTPAAAQLLAAAKAAGGTPSSDRPGGPWADLVGNAEPDEHADEVITAYPTARPGPAGAIYGVGITVLVTDLERSIAFYRDTLGFHEIDHRIERVPGVEHGGSAVLASGDTRLVLRTVRALSAEAGRLIFINLEVGDVEAVYQELLAKGVEFVHAPRLVNRGEHLELWSATFLDPDKHNVAVTQWRAIR